MRVRCEHNTLDGLDLAPALAARLRSGLRIPSLPLSVGREYVVYARLDGADTTWYYVLEEDRDDYPKAYAAPFFSVVDDRSSRFWVERRVAAGLLHAALAWAEDPTFYERLVDGEVFASQAWAAQREVFDLEFDRGDVQGEAEALGDGWLMCPTCGEAWESSTGLALVRCENVSCRTLLRRPGTEREIAL